MIPSVGHDEQGMIVIRSETRLSTDRAEWLRDRIDEELALLDGGKVTPETPATEECDADRHPKEGMGAPEYDIGDDADETTDIASGNDAEHERRDEPETSSGTPKTVEEGGLRALSDVGERTERKLTEREIETVEDVRETPKGDLLDIPGVGETVADRMLEEAGADPDTEEGDEEEPVLDHERVATAIDQVGVGESISAREFVEAVDLYNRTFQIESKLGMARGDVADLIQRLDLKDALESDDGVAAERFDAGEGGGVA